MSKTVPARLKPFRIVPAVLAAIILQAYPTFAAPTHIAPDPAIPHMRLGKDIPPPFGYVEFCARFPRDCKSSRTHTVDTPITLTAEKQAMLERINRVVNHKIQPFRDIDLYGTEEHWTYPQAAGDCEDYALLKMQHLLARGWPKTALLLAVAYDETGEAHTILLAVTDRGEFVLDNKTNDVLPWHKTGYTWLMRQSSEDPMRWVRIVG